MAGPVLADTSALFAVTSRRDQYHGAACAIGRRHLESGGRFVSTTLVLAELHTRLLHRRGPADARRVLGLLLADAAYQWLDVPLSLVHAATSAWLERFSDQHFSLCDAVSFELMRREKLTTAFAFDADFETAGFRLLR